MYFVAQLYNRKAYSVRFEIRKHRNLRIWLETIVLTNIFEIIHSPYQLVSLGNP